MKKFGHFLLMFICNAIGILHAQKAPPPSLNIGDTPPPLILREWIKGKPVEKLEKGHLYVVEFWATWCVPCIRAMPHLSTLARKYKRSTTILSINVFEKSRYPSGRAKKIIDSMGRQVKYAVAFQDSNFMENTWLNASAEYGLPTSFVVNKEGKIAWIGHPNELDMVLPKVIDNTWDISAALIKRDKIRYLNELGFETYDRIRDYLQGTRNGDDYGEPDSICAYLREPIAKEPELAFESHVAYGMFTSLLKTDMPQAYEYAKKAFFHAGFLDPPIGAITNGIIHYSDKLDIPPKLYQLCAEQLDGYAANTPKNLMLTAEYYWRAGDKASARRSLKKARKAMKAAKLYGKGYFF